MAARERGDVSFNICISTVISKYRERQSKKGRRGGWGGSLNAKAKERKDINVGDSKGKKNSVFPAQCDISDVPLVAVMSNTA